MDRRDTCQRSQAINMSWSRAVIFLGTLVFVGGTTSPRDQSGKFLFNIVRFANDACDAADGKTGVCMTSSECTKAGGGASGTCAKGYGTCCLLVKMTCGDTVTANNTYIRNPEYSASWKPTSKEQCSFTLENPGDVCQYRLDFDDLSLEAPTVGAAGAIKLGDCATDSMTITDVNKAVLPTICGKNSGQHSKYLSSYKKTPKKLPYFTSSVRGGRGKVGQSCDRFHRHQRRHLGHQSHTDQVWVLLAVSFIRIQNLSNVVLENLFYFLLQSTHWSPAVSPRWNGHRRNIQLRRI